MLKSKINNRLMIPLLVLWGDCLKTHSSQNVS